MITTIVSVSQFNGEKAKPNKNGMMPLYLTSLSAAQIPTRAKILDGTIAQRNGMIAGKNYLVKFEISGTTELGPNYSVANLGEVSAIDLVKMGAVSFNMQQAPVQQVPIAQPDGNLPF